MSERDVKKILVLRFSSLGDIVMATPMVRCLRAAYPSAKIDMIVRADFIDLIRHNPHLDEKIGLPRRAGKKGLLALREQINAEKYDLIYDAHRSLRTLFLMPRLEAPHKAYFQKHYIRRDLALTFKLPLLKNAPRMITRYIEPLENYGVKFDGRGPEIFLDEETVSSANFKVRVPKSDRTTIGVIPSAQWPGKRWPLPYFRELLERLIADTTARVILFGGPEDTFVSDLVADLPAERVINSQGKLTIGESAALLRHCDYVVANDTGLMHVADALDIPSVLILGPTSKELGCLPFHPRSQIMEHELWCRPCSKNGQAPCIRNHRVCLDRTSPADVFAATRRLEGVL